MGCTGSLISLNNPNILKEEDGREVCLIGCIKDCLTGCLTGCLTECWIACLLISFFICLNSSKYISFFNILFGVINSSFVNILPLLLTNSPSSLYFFGNILSTKSFASSGIHFSVKK